MEPPHCQDTNLRAIGFSGKGPLVSGQTAAEFANESVVARDLLLYSTFRRYPGYTLMHVFYACNRWPCLSICTWLIRVESERTSIVYPWMSKAITSLYPVFNRHATHNGHCKLNIIDLPGLQTASVWRPALRDSRVHPSTHRLQPQVSSFPNLLAMAVPLTGL